MWLLRVAVGVAFTLVLGAGFATAAGIGVISVFPTGGSYALSDIKAGADGNLWFGGGDTTTTSEPAIGSVTPEGSVTAYSPGEQAPSFPWRLALGPDGNIWFSNATFDTSPEIGEITPAGTVTHFDPEPGSSEAGGIAAGPDGNIWFTGDDAIWKMTTAGAVTSYQAAGLSPEMTGSIAPGPDGDMWFTVGGLFGGPTSAVGKITPDGTVTEYRDGLNASSEPFDIAEGPDGNMWFTDADDSGISGESAIGRITPTGQITEFSAGLDGTVPDRIAAGPDGNMWFTAFDQPALGEITPGGTITVFSTTTAPNNFWPSAIATGPDGDLWLAGADPSTFAGEVGRLSVGAPAASVDPPAIGGSGREGTHCSVPAQPGRVGPGSNPRSAPSDSTATNGCSTAQPSRGRPHPLSRRPLQT